MRRVTSIVAYVMVLVVAGWCVPAGASTPASGTLSKSKKKLSWTGEFTGSDPSPIEGCAGEDASPVCDRFALKIDLGEGATIKVSIPGQTATDIDLYVYAPGRLLVGSSGELPGAGEAVEFKHRARYRKQAYTVEVKPYLVVPGTTYKGTALVRTLGAK